MVAPCRDPPRLAAVKAKEQIVVLGSPEQPGNTLAAEDEAALPGEPLADKQALHPAGWVLSWTCCQALRLVRHPGPGCCCRGQDNIRSRGPAQEQGRHRRCCRSC